MSEQESCQPTDELHEGVLGENSGIGTPEEYSEEGILKQNQKIAEREMKKEKRKSERAILQENQGQKPKTGAK